MNFKKINNITGWVICIIACAVYLLTMEATGSLWDCGEFASSAYKLQIPHPPGAPLFVLLGRIFMIPFDPQHAATGVNTMSALASGFTILFLFWSITHFARKIVIKNGGELNGINTFLIMAAGAVGALAYTFTDSFWYSAVESEVYAMSSFFTAIVFWGILKWEQNVDEDELQGNKGRFTSADRWLILIFYLIGLGVGVHLLNLLTVPAIVMVYYYKRFTVTNWGVFWAFIVGCILTGFLQIGVIQWTIKAAGNFDIFFVNSLGLPFFFGFGFYFLLIGLFIYLGLRFNKNNMTQTRLGIWLFLFLAIVIYPTGANNIGFKIVIDLVILGAGIYFLSNKSLPGMKIFLWSFAFMVLGCFSSYFTTMVRSNADPAVDMYNVDNPVSLEGYLSRDQYGDWPILYGQDFTAQPSDNKITELYIKGKSKYNNSGRKVEYVFAPEDMHILPRMWDQSNDQGHADYYASWMGCDIDPKTGRLAKDKNGSYLKDGVPAKPTMGQNIGFALSYQFNWMFWRYFMWNFAGKQNDIEGIDMSNVRDGNWKTGIGVWDNMRLGNQNKIPDSIKHNKSNNKLFALPLILGLLGLVYHIRKEKQGAWVIGLLFLIIGPGVIFYLNQAGNQPRERDYAFVGAFYAFAIWIGIGVMYVKELLCSFIKNNALAGYTAAGICTLAVPVIMCSQEWDDHDRSHKTLARDLATDYLQSCDKNAILITFGDNDTYPLWYAQEVEGIRRDIRVINASLLGTDWYINQLRYKVNQSDPIDPIWTSEQIEGSNREIIYNAPKAGIDPNKYMDLYTMMKDYAGSDDPAKTEQGRDGTTLNIFPSKKVSLPVDINLVKQNGTVNATDSVVSEIDFEIPKNILFKNDAAILNMIAANKWKRPIYFTSQDAGGLGFQNYVRQDGLSYRLVPVLNSQVNDSWCFDKMMKDFKSCNADVNGVYFDEENRRHLNSIRLAYAQAAGNLANNGKKDEAIKMLEKCDKMLGGIDKVVTNDNGRKDTIYNFPYGMVSRGQQHNYFSIQTLIACYKAGDTTLGNKVYSSVKKDLDQQLTYAASLDENKQDAMKSETDNAQRLLMYLQQINEQFKNPRPLPQSTTDGGAKIITKPVATVKAKTQ